jgi:hypothetical protein
MPGKKSHELKYFPMKGKKVQKKQIKGVSLQRILRYNKSVISIF